MVVIIRKRFLEYQLMDSGHCLGGTGDELSYDDGIHVYLGSIQLLLTAENCAEWDVPCFIVAALLL